jgi:hypothetical protein
MLPIRAPLKYSSAVDFSTSAPAKVEPPPVFSVVSSSTSAKAPTKLAAEAAGPEARIFCLFPAALEMPVPFLFLDLATIVTFLAAALFDFTSIEARTFGGTLCSS